VRDHPVENLIKHETERQGFAPANGGRSPPSGQGQPVLFSDKNWQAQAGCISPLSNEVWMPY